MEKEALVYADIAGIPHLVGRLWARVRKDKEGASFEYDPAWLDNPNRFSLEPATILGTNLDAQNHSPRSCGSRHHPALAGIPTHLC